MYITDCCFGLKPNCSLITSAIFVLQSTERINQILEDMLRACVLTYGKNWENSLPYAEFSYNNSYQSSLKMSPFEALYGRKCRTPLMWTKNGDRIIEGPDFIKEAEDKIAESERI